MLCILIQFDAISHVKSKIVIKPLIYIFYTKVLIVVV